MLAYETQYGTASQGVIWFNARRQTTSLAHMSWLVLTPFPAHNGTMGPEPDKIKMPAPPLSPK